MPNQEAKLEPIRYQEYQTNQTTDQLSSLAKSFINWYPRPIKDGTKWSKVPQQKINDISQHLSLDKALAQSSMVGLVCNSEHSLIALDLDDVPLSHPQIHALLSEFPTYAEHSPSGKPNRHRLIYQINDLTDKLQNLAPKVSLKTQDGAIELFSHSTNYVTLTGQSIHDPALPIATLTTADLIRHLPFTAKTKTAEKIIPFPQTPTSGMRINNLTPIALWVDQVPCSRNDPQVMTYMASHALTYYEFWLQGIMSLHKTSAEYALDGYHYAKQWSQKSEEYDEEEFEQKWKSFSAEPSEDYAKVAAGTYMYLYNALVIQWPVTNAKGTPTARSIDNLMALMKHLGLSLGIDILDQSLIMQGPEHILIPYFYDTRKEMFTQKSDAKKLTLPLLHLARQYGFMIDSPNITQYLRDIAADIRQKDYVIRFERALLEEEAYDPQKEIDYIDHIFGDCLINTSEEYKHPTREMRVRLGRLWLRSLLRSFTRIALKNPRHRESTAEAMLILSGSRSGIGKTAFCRNILPATFSHLMYEPAVSTSRSLIQGSKDYPLAATKALLVNFDECGHWFKYTQESSDFIKQEVTTKVDTLRAPYAESATHIPRKYSLIASTNDSTIQLPREGARRFFWINVTDVDLPAFLAVSKMRLFKQVQYELENYEGDLAPWATTTSDRDYLASYLSQHQRTTNLEEVLHEMFDTSEFSLQAKLNQMEMHTQTDQSDAQDRAIVKFTYCATDIAQMLSSNPVAGGKPPNLKELKHTLKRFTTKLWPKQLRVKRTLFIEGHKKIGGQDRFLMPMPMGWQQE